MAGDWMALAFERFQSAARTVRLTLPPARHEAFWERLVQLAAVKRRGLAITLLLPADPVPARPLRTALEVLPQLEANGHEVGWAATRQPLPFSLFVVDDLWALLVAGDPDEEPAGTYVRLTDEPEEARSLREAFDRRVADGVWGLDPHRWLAWLDTAQGRRETRRAIRAVQRGRKRLDREVRRALRSLPRRRFWLVKPHGSAWGEPEPAVHTHWRDWVTGSHVALGWPRLAPQLAEASPKKLEGDWLAQQVTAQFPGLRGVDKMVAIARYFALEMGAGDRVAAMDGWSPLQSSPVRFHGWGRVTGGMQLALDEALWPLVRPTLWQRYEVELPVDHVRAATGLASATSPIHRLEGAAFRNLVGLAEQILQLTRHTQMTLDLALIPVNGAPQQEELL